MSVGQMSQGSNFFSSLSNFRTFSKSLSIALALHFLIRWYDSILSLVILTPMCCKNLQMIGRSSRGQLGKVFQRSNILSSRALSIPPHCSKTYLEPGLTSIKATFRGVLINRYSENMQQIYRRTPMPKCEITLRHGCSPVSLLHIFRTPFPKNISGRLFLRLR